MTSADQIDNIEIRLLQETDDMEAITDLVHRAYAEHARSGLRYWGTHQTVDDTRTRFASGTGFVAVREGTYVGTAVVSAPNLASEIPVYREPDVWSISQLCVCPSLQGHGLGKRIHTVAADYVRAHGGRRLALNTAEPATQLINLYLRWGYILVDTCDWRPFTNYRSVVLVLNLV